MNGTGTQTDPYLVATADDFNEIRNTISTTLTYYKQTADIDLSSYSNWVSLSISSSNKINYDGQNFAIKNIESHPTTHYYGFFGSFEADSIIKNLKIDNLYTLGSSTVVGISSGSAAYNLKIKNMWLEGSFAYTFHNGKSYKKIDIEGYIESTGLSCGLAYTNINSNIEDIKYTGTVIGFNVGAAGIVTFAGTHSSTSLDIKRCSFTGSVKSNSSTGGVVHCSSKTQSVKISDCVSRGLVEARLYAAGIVVCSGELLGVSYARNCKSEANIYSEFGAAGISYLATTNVSNCYALMNRIVRTNGTSTRFGRITQESNTTGPNYALDTMQFYSVDDRI